MASTERHKEIESVLLTNKHPVGSCAHPFRTPISDHKEFETWKIEIGSFNCFQLIVRYAYLAQSDPLLLFLWSLRCLLLYTTACALNSTRAHEPDRQWRPYSINLER